MNSKLHGHLSIVYFRQTVCWYVIKESLGDNVFVFSVVIPTTAIAGWKRVVHLLHLLPTVAL